ncbi:MAG: hypothetical protein OXK79_07215 [Chloroflexota bacterium]|nr:hypothetical protein [Chloroflexota bacterium]
MGEFVLQLGLWVSFIVLVLSSFMLGACILAAPIIAIVCGVVARIRGLSVWRYALAGGLYSMMFFLPVVYLAHRMFDRKIDPELVRAGLVAAYLTWFLAGVVGPFYFVDVLGNDERHGVPSFLPWLSAGTLISSILWIAIDRKRREPDNPYESVPEDTTLTLGMYFTPFALAAFWILATSLSVFGLEAFGLRLP